jgi:hypothetical protein
MQRLLAMLGLQWQSLFAGLLFFLLSLPQLYEFTNRLVTGRAAACPTVYTRPLHTALYFSATVGVMLWHQLSLSMVYPLAFLSSALFFMLISPDLYQMTHSIGATGSNVFCPSMLSIGIHAAVFAAIHHFLMQLGGFGGHRRG